MYELGLPLLSVALHTHTTKPHALFHALLSSHNARVWLVDSLEFGSAGEASDD
jgi:hypothetical protein